MDKFDPKYEKIACKLLEQLASEKLTFGEARLVVTLLETKINRAGNDSRLICENDPLVVSQKAQEIENAVSAGKISINDARKELGLKRLPYREADKPAVKLEYVPKEECSRIAAEVLDFLKPKELPIWQIKEVLQEAQRLSEWQKLKE